MCASTCQMRLFSDIIHWKISSNVNINSWLKKYQSFEYAPGPVAARPLHFEGNITSKVIENTMAKLILYEVIADQNKGSPLNISFFIHPRQEMELNLAHFSCTFFTPDISIWTKPTSLCKCDVPAMFVEVHSTTRKEGYECCITKLIANIIDIIRWYL
jgi:hypothetical protein